MLAAADAPVFDLDIFEIAYNELEDAFHATEVPMVLIAPLLGLNCGVETVQLSDGVEVVRPTDDELRMCLRLGLISGGTDFPMVHTSAIGAIRLTWDAAKVVGDDPLSEAGSQAALLRERERGQTVEHVVHALRLYKRGKLQPSGSVRFTPSPVAGIGMSFSGGMATSFFIHETYSLRQRDVRPLTKLWEGLRSPGVLSNTSLTGAIRRFGYAGERTRDDDKLIDLSIAAEALFLPQEQQELAHKLASRAAWFLRPRGAHRMELYRQFKHAYRARGALVHGDVPRNLHLADGSNATLATLTAEFEEFAREAILKGIEQARTGRFPARPDDWDELTLGLRPR